MASSHGNTHGHAGSSISRHSMLAGEPSTPTPSRKRKLMPDPFQSPESSPRLKLHFDGRVYRSGGVKAPVSPDRLLGAPDELSIDAVYDAVASSPTRRAKRRKYDRERTPTPTTRREHEHDHDHDAAADSNSDLEIKPAVSVAPFGSPNTPKSKATAVASRRIVPDMDPSMVDLPAHYAVYITLHAALERALMMHLSTEGQGGRIASAVAQAAAEQSHLGSYTVRLANLVTFTQLKPMVESGSKNSLTESQFAKLVWLWTDPDDDHDKQTHDEWDQVSGLGFIVTKMVDARYGSTTTTSRKTWGLGIELSIKRQTSATISLVNTPSSSPTPNQCRQSAAVNGRDGMSVVAIWSSGAEARKAEVRRRLGLLVLGHQQTMGLDTLPSTQKAMPPTPPPSNHKRRRHMLPDVPSARLPSLTPSVPRTSLMVALLNESEAAAEEADAKHVAQSTSTPSAKQRTASLRERIKAKELARQQGNLDAASRQVQLGLLSPTKKSLKANTLAAERERERMAHLKHKSMLSRLPDVADAVSMLLGVGQPICPSSPSGSSPVGHVRTRRAIPIEEASTMIAKSSRISLSIGEATSALKLLFELCPLFFSIKQIDHRDWICVNARGGPVMDLKQCKEMIKHALDDATM